MIARRSLALGRFAFACAIAIAIAVVSPAMPRLVASFARAHGTNLTDSVGWLGALAIERTYAGPFHYGGLVFVSTLAAAIAFLAVEARARVRVSGPLSFLAVLLAAACSLDDLRVGGGMVDAAFAAVVVLLLETTSLRAVLAAAVVTVLWCNVDASGIVAPLLAIVSAVAKVFDSTARPGDGIEKRNACYAAAAVTGAALLTPLGVGFFTHAYASIQLAGASSAYAAWTPADVAPHAYRIGFVGIAMLALAVGMRGVTVAEASIAAVTFVLALANGAFVPLFGIVAAPIVVGALGRRVATAASIGRDSQTAFARNAALATIVALGGGALAGARAIPVRANEPYDAIERLARGGAEHRVFCANLAWCDAAEAAGLRVVADGRIAERTQATRDAQVAIASMNRWRAAMRASAVDVAVVGADSGLATMLVASKWTVFARTTQALVLVAERQAR